MLLQTLHPALVKHKSILRVFLIAENANVKRDRPALSKCTFISILFFIHRFFSTSSFPVNLYWFRVCFPGKWSRVLSVNTDASVWVLSFLDSFVCNQLHTILSSQDCGLSSQKFPGPSYLPFSLNPCACLFSSFVHVACLHRLALSFCAMLVPSRTNNVRSFAKHFRYSTSSLCISYGRWCDYVSYL